MDVIYEEDDMPTQGINPKTLDFVDIQVLNQQSKEVINQAKTEQEKQEAIARKQAELKMQADLKELEELRKKNMGTNNA